MTRLKFFVEGVKNIKTVGTITRSSKYLCRRMIRDIDFENAKCIVELGAGDGVITEHILKAMRPDAKLLAFEVFEAFCEQLRELNDPRLIVIQDSAEFLPKYLKEHNIEAVDYVVSAIPFVALPDEVGYRIVDVARNALKKGGLYIQVHYSLLAKKLYEKIFGNVDVGFVMRNVPPAFVLKSVKN